MGSRLRRSGYAHAYGMDRRIERARKLVLSGDSDAALGYVNAVIQSGDSKDVGALLLRADILLSRRKGRMAEDAYHEVLRESRQHPYALLGLAEIRIQRRLFAMARRLLTRVLALARTREWKPYCDDLEVSARVLGAELEMTRKRPAAALSELVRGLEVHPASGELWAKLKSLVAYRIATHQ